jgi:translation initiation factor IF-2
MATLLVQSGTLKTGDSLVVETEYGRVKAMFDDTGQRVKEAGPSVPVTVMGLSNVPPAGARFEVVPNEKTARALTEARAFAARDQPSAAVARPMTLEELFERAAAGEAKTLNLIVKTDVQGSLEPVVSSLERLSGEVGVSILHSAAGDISESDVNLAAASDAVVIGFRVGPDTRAQRAAAAKNVELREYEVIYKLVEDIQDALTGMLEPIYEDQTIGTAEVRAVFGISRIGKIAGCIVQSGVVRRNATARVLRGGEEIARSTVSSLKRHTEDVREVREGFECGIGLANFEAFEEGDVLEFIVRERVR